MHAAEKRWFRARSSHFTVVTDLSEKRAVEPYVVPIADDEKDLYDKQRILATA